MFNLAIERAGINGTGRTGEGVRSVIRGKLPRSRGSSVGCAIVVLEQSAELALTANLGERNYIGGRFASPLRLCDQQLVVLALVGPEAVENAPAGITTNVWNY